MLSELHYLIRSRADGRYLTARVDGTDGEKEIRYLLIFREHHEALTYLNTHAAEIAQHFSVETIPASQLKALLLRWGYQGLGQVQDPIEPHIQFLKNQ
jgi:hypothetical protein